MFAIDHPVTGESFVVEEDAGWLSLIAGYTRFPEPRREKNGFDVLEPAESETMASLRAVMGHAIVELGAPCDCEATCECEDT